MRRSSDLSILELRCLVGVIQEVLFLDETREGHPFWNPDYVWEGADVCQAVAQVMTQFGLAPTDPSSDTPGEEHTLFASPPPLKGDFPDDPPGHRT